MVLRYAKQSGVTNKPDTVGDDPCSQGDKNNMLRSGFAAFQVALLHEARFAWTHWTGFACVLVWMFGLFWSNIFAQYAAFSAIDFLGVRATWLAVEAFSLLFLFFILKYNPLLFTIRWVPFGAGTLTTCGTLIVAVGVIVIQNNILTVLGIVMTGIGSATLLTMWGATLARSGSQSLLFSIGFSLFFASVADFILIYLPLGVQIGVVTLAPLVSISLYNRAVSGAESAPQAPFVLDASTLDAARPSMPWRILILPLLVGLSYGFMQRLAMFGDFSAGTTTELLTISTFFITGLVFIATAVFFMQDRVLRLVYFIALPLMVTAFALFPLLDGQGEKIQAVFMVGFNYFYFMVWTFWAGSWQDQNPSLERRFAIGLFVLVASESLGSVLALPLGSFQSDSRYVVTIISLLAVYLLMMGALFSVGRLFNTERLLGQKNVSFPARTKMNISGKNDTVGKDHTGTVSLVEDLVTRYDLSHREQDVLALLIKGRNRAYISKTLYISDNTTRTHMRNIYRKLKIHSHQELLDLLEPEEE